MFQKNSVQFTLWILLLAFFVQTFFDPLGTSRLKDDFTFQYTYDSNSTETSTFERYKDAALDYTVNHKYSVLLLLIFLPFSFDVYAYFFLPLNITKTIEEVEQGLEGKRYPGKRPRRSMGQLPPPYPNSWYKVMNSHELGVGDVRDIEMFGQQFVVYRGRDDKKPHILDAYCPHMGAHLGVGGTVVGDEVVCPFHGWQFQGDGKCSKVPYADGTPSSVGIRSWPSTEVNGAIYVWHDAENREPQWMVPEIHQISDGTYRFHGNSTHQVRAHIQEIPENGADTAHLNFLHLPIFLDLPFVKDHFTHTWECSWEEGKGIEQHLAHIKLRQGIKFLNKWPIPGTFLDVNITQVGPSSVQLSFMTVLGKVLVFETVTPIQPLLQRVTHQVFAESHIPRFFAKFIMRGLITQFERDVPIWNNKTFVRSPWIVKQDGPIARYRRWFAKNFYSENSEKVALERRKDTAGAIDW